VNWECSSSESYSQGNVNDTVAQNWEQCDGEGRSGATSCVEYPCQPRSDCLKEWICSEIPDEGLELYNPEDVEEEEAESILRRRRGNTG
jgi:hypothetical protein